MIVYVVVSKKPLFGNSEIRNVLARFNNEDDAEMYMKITDAFTRANYHIETEEQKISDWCK